MKSLKLHRSKRWWIVVGVSSAILLCVIVYSLYSFLSWQSYQKRVTAWQASSKQALSNTLSLKSTSDAERLSKRTALKAMARDLHQNLAHICDPARLTGWQLAINSARDARADCGAYAQKVESIVKQLDKVNTYLDNESVVMDELQPVVSLPEAVNEKNWEQTATAWSGALTAVSATSSSASFTVTKERITSVVAGIDTSWKELIAAHGKKDKAAFVAATTKLQTCYAALTDITTVSDAQLRAFSSELQQMYNKL